MSEDAWRRKTYYNPRVLINLATLLDPPLMDALVCLTGAERLIIQNLLAYGHRHSTFVAEYHEGYYFTPDNDDWDTVQAIVAGMEYKLMNCDLFSQQIEDLLALAEQAALEPYLANIYQELYDDGTIAYGLADGTPVVADEEECAVAQLTWALMYEFLTETLEPLEELLHSVLLSAVLGLIATAIGGPVLGMSVASLTALITAALNAGVKSDLENVRNELVSLKQDLCCAMYESWSTGGTYADAASAAAEIINDSSVFSPIDKLFMRRGFSPAFMAQAQAAYDAATAWATGNVQAGYCDACEQQPVEGTDWIAYIVDQELTWDTQSRPHACVDIGAKTGLTLVGLIVDQYWDGVALQYWPVKGDCGLCGSACADMFVYTGMWGELNNDTPGPNTRRYTIVNGTNIDQYDLYDTLGDGGELITDNVNELASGCGVGCIHCRNATDKTHLVETVAYAVYRES